MFRSKAMLIHCIILPHCVCMYVCVCMRVCVCVLFCYMIRNVLSYLEMRERERELVA